MNWVQHWLRSARVLFPIGMGVKRWLVLLVITSAFLGLGFAHLLQLLRSYELLPDWMWQVATFQFLQDRFLRIGVLFFIGLIGMLVAIRGLGRTLIAPFRHNNESIITAMQLYQQRKRGPRIVAIGGGTGMPALLRGLKEQTSNITVIVTVADDGGSSGRLRRELGMLPPGDFRNNIAALARDETLMTQLIQYRFGKKVDSAEPSQLQGHAFGNLLIAALTGITGSFDEALLAMDKVLAMRGRVMPSTLQEVVLCAEINVDGNVITVRGESAIPKAHGQIERLFLDPPEVKAYPPALQAILQADLIVMGPGSLFTSVLPNLLVDDLANAIRYSRAKTVYVCNLAMQPGETDGFDSADYIAAILTNAPSVRIDYLLVNNNLALPEDRGGGQTLFVQPMKHPACELISADLVDEQRPWRHDSTKVASAVLNLLSKN